MNTIKLFAMLAALVLTTAQFLVIDRDARQRAAHYQVEAAKAAELPPADVPG